LDGEARYWLKVTKVLIVEELCIGVPITRIVVCCHRQPKIKPLLLKIHVVVQVRVDLTESI
jgi:hypothetical protein